MKQDQLQGLRFLMCFNVNFYYLVPFLNKIIWKRTFEQLHVWCRILRDETNTSVCLFTGQLTYWGAAHWFKLSLNLQESEAPPPPPPAAVAAPPAAAAPKAKDESKREPEPPPSALQCSKPPSEPHDEEARLKVLKAKCIFILFCTLLVGHSSFW